MNTPAPSFLPCVVMLLLSVLSCHCLEDVIGCKWSVGVVAAISQGVKRPGELERFVPGIIPRTERPRPPARVDYALTPAGEKPATVRDQLLTPNAELAEDSGTWAPEKP